MCTLRNDKGAKAEPLSKESLGCTSSLRYALHAYERQHGSQGPFLRLHARQNHRHDDACVHYYGQRHPTHMVLLLARRPLPVWHGWGYQRVSFIQFFPPIIESLVANHLLIP